MRAMLAALALTACSAQPADRSEPAQQEQPPASEQAPAPTASSSAEAALASLPSWERARAAGVDFRGVGQEPGWIVDIYADGRIVLVWDYGEHRFEFPASQTRDAGEGVTRHTAQHRGHEIEVARRRFPCRDGMSGEAYPARVDVIVDGRTLSGCGRSV